MSPGPSSVLIIKTGIRQSRIEALQISIGTVLGTFIQCSLVLLGLSIIAQDSILMRLIKVSSCIYLLYLGIRILMRYIKNFLNQKNLYTTKISYQSVNKVESNKSAVLIEGLLVEFLNPLAFSFFVSLMSTIINNYVQTFIKILFVIEIVALATFWFGLVAIASSNKMIVKYLNQYGYLLDIISAFIFIFFAIKLSGFIG